MPNVIGIFIWNLEGRIVDANEAFLHMVEYDRGDIVSGRMRWTDLTPAEWRDRDARALTDLEEAGTAQPYEKEFFRKDGSRVPVLAGAALFQEGGNEGVAFVLDLSEPKRAEKALRRSESYLAQAQRLAHIGSWVWEVAGRNALYLSEEWYRIYAFDPKDGMPPWEKRLERVHPDDRARWQVTIDRAIAEKSSYDLEFRILTLGESIRVIHSAGEPVLGPSGELLQFVGVAMDVTESRRAEEEREKLRQELAHLAYLNRVSTMGELTASLAHEINQPIGAAVTNAEACLRFLDRDQPDVLEAREAALEMARDARRAADIIERIRSLYRKGPSHREMVDVNELIGEMVVMLRNEANRHSVTMRTELAESLPKVLADRVPADRVSAQAEGLLGQRSAKKLAGKVAVITGGSTGIGLATAKRFAQEGMDHVFITGRRKGVLDAAVAEIGEKATGIPGDVANLNDLDRLYQAVKRYGRKIDVIFANAGVARLAPFGSVDEKFFDLHFDANVKGLFFSVQKGLPFLNDGGSIILTGSIADVKGFPAMSGYSATKAAVRSFARTWTNDLRDHRIRVNVLSPGHIDTPIMESLQQGEALKKMKQEFANNVPLGRMGDPDEIAKAASFLASDEASYVSGIELYVDGGVAQI